MSCGGYNGGGCGSMCETVDGAIHCHKNRLLKKIFTLIALLFMFWLGLQLGELRTLTRMQDDRDMGMNQRMMGEHNMMWTADMQATPVSSTTITMPAEKK